MFRPVRYIASPSKALKLANSCRKFMFVSASLDAVPTSECICSRRSTTVDLRTMLKASCLVLGSVRSSYTSKHREQPCSPSSRRTQKCADILAFQCLLRGTKTQECRHTFEWVGAHRTHPFAYVFRLPYGLTGWVQLPQSDTKEDQTLCTQVCKVFDQLIMATDSEDCCHGCFNQLHWQLRWL